MSLCYYFLFHIYKNCRWWRWWWSHTNEWKHRWLECSCWWWWWWVVLVDFILATFDLYSYLAYMIVIWITHTNMAKVKGICNSIYIILRGRNRKKILMLMMFCCYFYNFFMNEILVKIFFLLWWNCLFIFVLFFFWNYPIATK